MDAVIISWNVNGFRAVVKKGFWEFVKHSKPWALGLQEIKSKIKPLETAGYQLFWNPAKKEGYAGTALLAREKPLAVTYGLGVEEFDAEGRVITAEFEKFFLINVYFPHARHDLSRLDFKLAFNKAFEHYCQSLREKKPLVIMGDFNVAYTELDIARPRENEGNPGFTAEEREWMKHFLSLGYVDTFRYFHPNERKYSWWTYKFNARARNIGWRIDYVLVTTELITAVREAFILTEVYGSDHAPVGIKLKI